MTKHVIQDAVVDANYKYIYYFNINLEWLSQNLTHNIILCEFRLKY